jgi:hypothetical protein
MKAAKCHPRVDSFDSWVIPNFLHFNEIKILGGVQHWQAMCFYALKEHRETVNRGEP